MRGSRLQIEAQYAVIKALDRGARRRSSNPKLAVRVFLDGETILAAFCHLHSPRRSRIALRTRKTANPGEKPGGRQPGSRRPGPSFGKLGLWRGASRLPIADLSAI